MAKKVIVLVLALVLTSTLLFGVSARAKPAPAVEAIKIGVLLPFTGAIADYGPLCKDGVLMAFEEVNNTVAGRPVKLIIEDDATDSSMALEKAKKMVEVDKVGLVIGPIMSSMAMALAPYFAQNKILDFGFMHHPIEIKEHGVVMVWPGTLYSSGLPMGRYAYEKSGYRTATALGADYVAGKRLVGGMMDGFKEKGGKVIQEQWAPVGTADFGPYLAAMKKDVDVVMFWSPSGDFLRFVKQYHEFGLKMPLVFAPASSLKAKYMKEIGKKILGAMGLVEYTWRIDNPANKKFVAAFEAKYKRKPDKDEGNIYIIASAVIAALKATGGDTSYDKLRQAVLNLKIDTPAGPLSFTPSGFAVTNRYISKASIVKGEYVWDPAHTYTDVRDPRDPR